MKNLKIIVLIIAVLSPFTAIGSNRCDPFKEYPAETWQERELEAILKKSDSEIDLALVNFLITSELPRFRYLSREKYFEVFNSKVQKVSDQISYLQNNPETAKALQSNPANLVYVFSKAVLDLGLNYPERYRTNNLTPQISKEMYSNEENLFLTGLLTKGNGTCTSLPMLYVTIAQKLKFPVHYVHIGRHYFARWEQFGFKMNIEATQTDKVTLLTDDKDYLKMERLTSDMIKGTTQLKNLTNREVIAALLTTRMGYYMANQPDFFYEALLDISRAKCLNPNEPLYSKIHSSVSARFNQFRRLVYAKQRVLLPSGRIITPKNVNRRKHAR